MISFSFKDEITNPFVTFKLYEDRNHIVTAKDGEYDYEVLEEIKSFFDDVS